jgi:hypothetical protein
VISGGYNSCVNDRDGNVSPFGSGFTAKGVSFVNEMNDHFREQNWRGLADRGIRWLFTCFNKRSDLYLQSSSDDHVIHGGSWGTHTVLRRVETLSDQYRRPIFLIGHSHGGWLAMQVAEAMRSPLSHGYLATIDPISFVECNAATFADAISSLITGWTGAWGQLAPCQRAPGDFQRQNLERIRTNLDGQPWKHYYQQHFHPLHSGPMHYGPDSSLDFTSFFNIRYGGAASSWSAHTRIAYLSSIWHGLGVSFKRSFDTAAE